MSWWCCMAFTPVDPLPWVPTLSSTCLAMLLILGSTAKPQVGISNFPKLSLSLSQTCQYQHPQDDKKIKEQKKHKHPWKKKSLPKQYANKNHTSSHCFSEMILFSLPPAVVLVGADKQFFMSTKMVSRIWVAAVGDLMESKTWGLAPTH